MTQKERIKVYEIMDKLEGSYSILVNARASLITLTRETEDHTLHDNLSKLLEEVMRLEGHFFTVKELIS